MCGVCVWMGGWGVRVWMGVCGFVYVCVGMGVCGCVVCECVWVGTCV